MSHYNVAWGNRAFVPCLYYEFPATVQILHWLDVYGV